MFRAKRALFASPLFDNFAKKPKSGTVESPESIDTSRETIVTEMDSPHVTLSDFSSGSFQETIVSKVTEALSIFKSNGDGAGVAGDALEKMIPMMVTAMSVAVGEVVKGVMSGIEERLAAITSLQPRTDPNSERLLSAVRVLTYENDRLQQYTRRESVRVFGVKQSDKETTEEVEQKVIKIFHDAGVEVGVDDIAAAHRVGKAVKGMRPVIVKFVSRRKRNEIMKQKKQLKDKQEYKHVYINDDITPLRARMLGYIKKMGTFQAWTFDGKIYCAKKVPLGLHPSDRPKPTVIETPDDLFKLGINRVDYASLGLPHLEEPVSATGAQPSAMQN